MSKGCESMCTRCEGVYLVMRGCGGDNTMILWGLFIFRVHLIFFVLGGGPTVHIRGWGGGGEGGGVCEGGRGG